MLKMIDTWTPRSTARSTMAANGLFTLVLGMQLLILVAAFLQPWRPIQSLLRDGGAISDLGVMLWTATAAVCGLTSLVLLIARQGQRSAFVFLFGAIFSGVLAGDDMFLLHDSILPHLGIPELTTFALYVAIAFGYTLASWHRVFAAAPLHLAFTGLVLALGLGIDVFKDMSSGPVRELLIRQEALRIMGEDGFKFVGIGCWFTLHVRAALVALERAVRFGV